MIHTYMFVELNEQLYNDCHPWTYAVHKEKDLPAYSISFHSQIGQIIIFISF